MQRKVSPALITPPNLFTQGLGDEKKRGEVLETGLHPSAPGLMVIAVVLLSMEQKPTNRQKKLLIMHRKYDITGKPRANRHPETKSEVSVTAGSCKSHMHVVNNNIGESF